MIDPPRQMIIKVMTADFRPRLSFQTLTIDDKLISDPIAKELIFLHYNNIQKS